MGTSTLSHHVIILNPNLNKVKKLNLFINLNHFGVVETVFRSLVWQRP